MSSIDRRIVEMRFNNREFQKNALDTVSTLDGLKKALNFDGVGDGLGEVEKQASRFSLSGIVDGVRNAVDNFPILGAIGFSAINRLTNSAIDFGKKFVNNVVSPLRDGGWTRAMNIEQAQFQLKGLGIEWESIKPAILGAVEGTAYGLDEAARVASQLSASQVPLDKMESSLRAVSGVAAMTGSEYDSIGSVFTKVAGQGRVMGDDLLRLSSRGMNAAATMAEAMGLTEAEVRKMVTDGKISFEMFASAMDEAFGEHATKANETYTGALANMRAALARIGAESATIKMEKHRRMFNALAPAINDVAKALEPVWELMGERAERSAARFEKAVQWVRDAFAEDLAGGIAAVVGGVRNILGFIDRLTDTISAAWRSVFPGGGEGFVSSFFTNLGKSFEWFTGLLDHTGGALNLLGTILRVVFQGLATGLNLVVAAGNGVATAVSWVVEHAQLLWTILQPTIAAVREFFQTSSQGDGGVGIWQTLTEALVTLRDYAMVPINAVAERLSIAIQNVAAAAERGDNRIRAFIDTFRGLGGEIAEVTGSIDFFDNAVVDFFKNVGSGIMTAWGMAKPFVDGLMDFLGAFATGIGDSIVNLTSGDILSAVNVGVFAALASSLIGAIREARKTIEAFRGGIEGISGVLENFQGVLKAYQNNLNADTLKQIAIAIGILAAALVVMSFVNADNLGAASGAMLKMMGGMVGIMAALSATTKFLGAAKLPVIAIAMNLVATAMVTMSAALAIVASMDPANLTSSVQALSILVGVMVGMMGALAGISTFVKPGQLIAMAIAMQIMAVALAALAGVIAIFGTMDLATLEQGMVATGIALAGMTIAGVILGRYAPQMLAGSVGLMAMALALNMLLIPITAFGLMPLDVLLQGGLAVVALLTAMTAAGVIMGEKAPLMLLGSLGMAAMAFAVGLLVPSILALGAISWEMLGQGIAGIAVTMLLLVGAAHLMKSAMPGAAAMIAMAIAVQILGAAIATIGWLPMSVIATGLIAIAGALAILLVAAILAKFASAGLMVLAATALVLSTSMLLVSVALILFGPAAAVAAGGLKLLGMAAVELAPHIAALLLAGVGLAVFGAALALVAVAALALAVAMLIMGVGLTLLATSAIPAADAILYLVEQLTSIGLLDMAKLALVSVSFTALGIALIALGLGALAAGVGMLAFAVGWAGMAAIIAITALPLTQAITYLANAIEPMVERMVTSMQAASRGVLPAIASLQMSFRRMTESIITSIRGTSGAMRDAGSLMGESLIAGVASTAPLIAMAAMMYITVMLVTLSSGIPRVAKVSKDLNKAFVDPLKAGSVAIRLVALETVRNYTDGLDSRSSAVTRSGRALTTAAVRGMRNGISGVASSMSTSGYSIGISLTNGMRNGIRGGALQVRVAAQNVARAAATAAKAALDIRSPSREGHWIGLMFDRGISGGIEDGVSEVSKASTSVGTEAMASLKKAINDIGQEVFDELDGDMVLTPILDLTDVERGVSSISKMFEPVMVGATSESASAIASRHQVPGTTQAPAQESITVEYHQTNNSPKALPVADIYRRTKNQLSQVRNHINKTGEVHA